MKVFACFLAFLGIIFSIPVYGSSSGKNNYILILSAYGYDNTAYTNLAKAVKHKTEEKDPGLFVHIVYAGIGSRRSFIADRLGMQSGFSAGKISRDMYMPSVLVLIGDEAWMLYRIMNLRGLWEKVPVVLCGIRSSILKDYTDFYTREDICDSLLFSTKQSVTGLPVTGILSDDNVPGTLSMIRTLLPQAKEIHYIHSGNYQDEYNLNRLRSELRTRYATFRLHLYHLNETNRDSLRKVIAGLPAGAPLLLSDNNTEYTSPAPIFSLSGENLTGENIVGGFTGTHTSLASATADLILRLHDGAEASSIPFATLPQTAPRLNQKAVLHFDLKERADKIPGRIYSNKPEPFFSEHIRIIFFLLILAAIVSILAVYMKRVEKHSRMLGISLKKYKRLYNEYIAVYENMPVGLAMYDSSGKPVSRNTQSAEYYRYISRFNLTPDTDLKEIRQVKTPSFETLYKTIPDENGGNENTLAIFIDHSGIEHEKQEKHKIFNQLIFAMEASGLGVARYNLYDNKGFANRIWKKHLGQEEDTGFGNAYRSVVPADLAKIQDFKKKALEGSAATYTAIIAVTYGNRLHWLKYAARVMQYAPQEKTTVLVELLMNIDQQKQKERELTALLQKAQEFYKLKNAFISNANEELCSFINNIDRLVSVLDTSRSSNYDSLANSISAESGAFLSLLTEIIKNSVKESEKPEDGA